MKKVLIATAVMGAALPAAANATQTTFMNGVYSLPSGLPANSIFETFNSPATNPGVFTSPGGVSATAGVYTYSNPSMSQVYNGTVPGFAAAAGTGTSINDNYLAVTNNPVGSLNSSAFTVSFATGVQFFSFVFGTLDSYNSVTLTFADNTTLTLIGKAIENGLTTSNTAPGTPPTTYGDTGRVTYDQQGGVAIKSVTFGSTFAALEIDDLAAAAPEPATWALMILGFGMVGGMLRATRRRAKVAIA